MEFYCIFKILNIFIGIVEFIFTIELKYDAKFFIQKCVHKHEPLNTKKIWMLAKKIF